METVTLRDAIFNDLDAVYGLFEQIQNLHVEFHPDIFKVAKNNSEFSQFFQAIIESNNESLVLAVLVNQPVAYIHYFLGKKAETVFNHAYPFAFIYQIIVDEKYRKKSISKRLLEHVKIQADDFGAIGIAIDHFAFNSAARQCFKSAGFEINREFLWLDIDA